MSDRRYTQDHEWAQLEDNDTVTVGITDFAQEQLGDIVFIELPPVGETFDAGEELAVIESVKAAAELKSPVSGTVIEVNEELEDSPETVNMHPTEDGWFCRIKMDDVDEFDELMDSDEYEDYLTELE